VSKERSDRRDAQRGETATTIGSTLYKIATSTSLVATGVAVTEARRV
jgi:hypothetical protein